MRVTERLLAPAPEQTGSSPDHTNWQPLEKAPVGEPVLLVVPGRDAPVVAIQDEDGDWQVTWNGTSSPTRSVGLGSCTSLRKGA
jgi:hypothetical protein